MFGIEDNKVKGDVRVERALRELGIGHKLDERGCYRFGINLQEGRSQIGLINSNTYDFAGVELRDVFSVGLRSFGPFDARTAGVLLSQNSHLRIGAWCVHCDDSDNHLAIFSAKVSADLVGKPLLNVLVSVCTTADGIEQRLSGRDDF